MVAVRVDAPGRAGAVIPAALRKWFAVGSGAGIQITGPRGAESLRIAAVRVRPNGARLRGGFTIEDFPHQPAGAWGTGYAAFLKKLGMQHVPATVILPRQDVIVRTLALPGVSDKDLDSAVRFQMEGLHPYNEDDVFSSWTRLPGTSSVLIAVVRRDAVERYAALFEEAGIRVQAFTSSAPAVYSALRLFGAEPPRELLAWDHASPESDSGPVEFYGESVARAILSASFEIERAAPDGLQRAAALAAAELRVDPQIEIQPLSAVLGAEVPLPYAAALASACPRLTLPLNLLPVGRRQVSSPMRWIPSAALGVLVLALAAALAVLPRFQDSRYLQVLNAQIEAVAPQAGRAAQIDKDIDSARRRTQLLDDLRRRPKSDMDVLSELTRRLPPPTWLTLTEISPRQVVLGGEAEQAAPLLKVLDSSPLFEGSEFQSLSRIPVGEMFRIRTNREGVPASIDSNGASR